MSEHAAYAVRDETGVPGAVCSVEELTDDLVVERNGAGSIVAYVHPFGLEDPHENETPEQRVERLSAELKEAKVEAREAREARAEQRRLAGKR